MKYRAWVVGADGVPALDRIQASSLDHARAIVAERGGTLVAVDRAGIAAPSRFLKIQRLDLRAFTDSLLSLLDAGLTINEALAALRDDSIGSQRASIDTVVSGLNSGRSLSDALESEGSFPALFISLVRASEQTSDLQSALRRYGAYAESVDRVKDQAIAASIYPAIVIAVGGAAVAFLLLYVVPRFSGVYDSIHTALPWGARLMLDWGKFVHRHGAGVASILALLVTLTIGILATHSARMRILSPIVRSDAVARLLRPFFLARFYRTVGMLLEGGLPLVQALEMSGALLPEELHLRAADSVLAIREGRRPSAVLKQHGLTTAVSDQLLSAGENTGRLDKMATRVALFYEIETERTIARLTRIMEPVLMALVGVGIGAIVVLMYLPIFELAGAIQ